MSKKTVALLVLAAGVTAALIYYKLRNSGGVEQPPLVPSGVPT